MDSTAYLGLISSLFTDWKDVIMISLVIGILVSFFKPSK